MSNRSANLDVDSRIEKYEQILKDNPEDLSALMSFAEASLRRGKRLAALTAYQKIIQEKPETIEAHLALAKIYFIQNFHNAALEELKRVFELDPVSVEGHILYREMVAKIGTTPQWAEGLQQFLNYQLRDSDLSLYHRQLEIEQWQLGKEIQEMENILAAHPDILLEYHRNIAIKRRNTIKNLIDLLHTLTPSSSQEKQSAVTVQPAEEPDALKPEQPIQPLQQEPLLKAPEAEQLLTSSSLTQPEQLPVPLKPTASAREEISIEPIPEVKLREVVSLPSMEKIQPVWDTVKKTRGVTGLFLINSLGEVVREEDTTSDMSNAVAQLLRSAINSIKKMNSRLVYWVAEYEHGLMVLSQLAPGCFIVVLGDKGVNFGALRLAFDKGRKTIADG